VSAEAEKEVLRLFRQMLDAIARIGDGSAEAEKKRRNYFRQVPNAVP
jgi:hypothetical protein